jgi:hypothetical protein
LRCTFCRRTYKGGDRVCGSTSNSTCISFCMMLFVLTELPEENRHAYHNSDDGGRRSMKLEPASPQDNYGPLSCVSSSRFHSLARTSDFGVPLAPNIEQNKFPMPTISVDFPKLGWLCNLSPLLLPLDSYPPNVTRRTFSELASPSLKCSEAVT